MDILQNLSTQIKFVAGFDVKAWRLYLVAQVSQLVGQELFLSVPMPIQSSAALTLNKLYRSARL